MTMKVWNVEGTIVIPGTRDKGTFGPVKVIAHSRQEASQNVANDLQAKFGKEAKSADRRPYKFSPHFALYNLQFREVSASK